MYKVKYKKTYKFVIFAQNPYTARVLILHENYMPL